MRYVIVTGGGTGIGFAVAERFARGGDQVTITGRREHVLKDATARLGAGAGYVAFDASDPAAIGAALPRLPERVDVLVNNAGGVAGYEQPAAAPGDLEAIAAQWRADFGKNVLSAVLVTEALSPRLRDNARIVTLGSIAARRGAGSYGAAKAAVETWTASVATALGPRGITANVVSPGYTTGSEFFRDSMTTEREARLVAETKNGRPGSTDDVAGTVEFLASPLAGHLTGQVIHVNGGAYLGR